MRTTDKLRSNIMCGGGGGISEWGRPRVEGWRDPCLSPFPSGFAVICINLTPPPIEVTVQCWIPSANQGLDRQDGFGCQEYCPERGEKNGKVEARAKAIERQAVYFVQVGDPRKPDARDAFCAIFFSLEIYVAGRLFRSGDPVGLRWLDGRGYVLGEYMAWSCSLDTVRFNCNSFGTPPHHSFRAMLIGFWSRGLFNFLIKVDNERKELARNEGILYPANLPRPNSQCSIATDDFALFAGSNVVFGQGIPPTLLSLGGQEIISGGMTSDGGLGLRVLKLYDDRDNILTHIDEKGLWVEPSARKSRPDRSTLIVYDHNDAEALNVRFLNQNTISIMGIFRVKGRSPVVVTDNSIHDMRFNATITNECYKNIDTGLNLN